MLKNLEFAGSVQALAAQGAKALHTGKYAQNIVSVVQNAKDNPGQLSLQDLSDYQVVERPPVCATYRIFDLLPLLKQGDSQYRYWVFPNSTRLAHAD